MVILFGLGNHFKDVARKHYIPFNDIELIIDNKLAQDEKYVGKILSWEEFLERKNDYSSNTIVIGTQLYYDEIWKNIMESGMFLKENICYIDDWVVNNSVNEKILFDFVLPNFLKEEESSRSLQVGFIDDELLSESTIVSSREAVLKLLPKGGVAAEIGVAFGGFSKKIIEALDPDIFYAIDLFDENTKGIWGNNIFEEEKISHYDWYCKEFNKLIDRGKVKVEKGFSWEVLMKFPDEYFDYIYLDASHDYISVSRDIEQILKKIKRNGIVQFNDYTFQQNYGVIPAVNEMIKKSKSKLLYYCLAPGGYADVVVRINKTS